MKRSPAFLSSLLLLIAPALPGCSEDRHAPTGAALRPPRLVFDDTSFDFGAVPQGTLVRHEFRFANEGDLDLSVARLRTASDCTAVLVGGSDIPAGGSGAVRAAFDTDAVFGEQRRTVTVYSNDPDQRAILLALSVVVELDVIADPPQLYLGAVRRGRRADREVAIRAGNNRVRVYSAATEGLYFTVELLPPSDGTSHPRLAIDIAPDAPPGPFSQVVRVVTSSAKHPVLQVAVFGVVGEGGGVERIRP